MTLLCAAMSLTYRYVNVCPPLRQLLNVVLFFSHFTVTVLVSQCVVHHFSTLVLVCEEQLYLCLQIHIIRDLVSFDVIDVMIDMNIIFFFHVVVL